ncbi:hypothetical protein Bhyg_15181 [Pseudolycoriella hygida]|uniref:Uncharacterized protein n=1 Tax=Pseudolycoriella hygida TaxID=35572 RepID=A0A9Q0MRD4_9DIPT|nr:hypothetical protein Bhyg_15181 [Pseudolycoriella hygida]
MKNFIPSTLASLCLLTLHVNAVNVNPECENELSKLKESSRNFINEFKDLHDRAHGYSDVIASLCTALFAIEHSFFNGNYATDAHSAKAALQTFFDGYGGPASGASAKFAGLFDSIDLAADELLKMGFDFVSSNELPCSRNRQRRGCEMELNERRCELLDFLSSTKTKRDKIKSHIKDGKVVLADMNDAVADFSAINLGEDYCKVRTAINDFFTSFNKLHWEGHMYFVNFQSVCDEITAEVSKLFVKYNDC